MHEKYEQLKAILAQVWDLNSASGLLGWDQQTYMPPKGAQERGEALATLSSIAHKMGTSDEVSKLVEELVP